MRGGDISLMKLGDPDLQASSRRFIYTHYRTLTNHLFIQFETIGSFEDGIQAAAWSPDDSLLILVTGKSPISLRTVACLILCRGGEVDCHDVIFRCSSRIRLTY